MSETTGTGTPEGLQRRLGAADAVVIGLGSMLGAGTFVALAPAAGAAGSGLLIGLAVAAIVAYCNASSSGRLAARYPVSGGTYVYGRERLGEFWGYLAGWCFVVGKTASCAAMALTVGLYIWPEQAHAVAVAAVVLLTAVTYRGVQKSALATRIIVAIVLAVLAAVVVAGSTSGSTEVARLGFGTDITVGGVLQAGGLLFFAFAGYARIATLGEEVREPARTIPRAISMALGVTLLVYLAVASVALLVLGPRTLAEATAPLSSVVTAAGVEWLEPVVRAGRRCRSGFTARLGAGSVAHHLRDGTGPASATRADRGAPPVRGATSSRTRCRSDRRGRRRNRRCPCRDRILVVRGAGLLRRRQRLRLDASGRATRAHHRFTRAGRMPDPGVHAARLIGAHRYGRDRSGRADLRHTSALQVPAGTG